ncbi:sodium-coupled monocarboxylate transporter 2-like [Haliotis rufescens]|uniref:sodium-coupled monocarboxylate transporter 2-like n=1 Tax=Haliotis rufescens TaxID=6454 RepID=UPI00201F9232|nr:sodium-coupled monocarboxylate transporter 2-like [Haliotis rufescens]
MYRLSYLYYSLVALLVVCAVGSIVSFLTGPVKPETLDPRLICPLFDKLFPFLPERVLKPLRFGIVHKGKYRKAATDHDQDENVEDLSDNVLPLTNKIESTDDNTEGTTWNRRL